MPFPRPLIEPRNMDRRGRPDADRRSRGGGAGLVQMLVKSEAFDNASWTKAGTAGAAAPVVTANTIVAPDGNTTAESVAFSAVVKASSHANVLRQSRAVTAAPHTFSCHLRVGSGTGTIYLMSTLLGTSEADWRVAACSLTTSWQRFSLTLTPTAASWFFYVGYDYRAGSLVADSLGAQTIHVWGAHLAPGSSVRPYLIGV